MKTMVIKWVETRLENPEQGDSVSPIVKSRWEAIVRNQLAPHEQKQNQLIQQQGVSLERNSGKIAENSGQIKELEKKFQDLTAKLENKWIIERQNWRTVLSGNWDSRWGDLNSPDYANYLWQSEVLPLSSMLQNNIMSAEGWWDPQMQKLQQVALWNIPKSAEVATNISSTDLEWKQIEENPS